MRGCFWARNVELPPRDTGSSYRRSDVSVSDLPQVSDQPFGSVLSGSALDDFRRTAKKSSFRATLARRPPRSVPEAAYSDSARRALADMSYSYRGAEDLDPALSSFQRSIAGDVAHR